MSADRLINMFLRRVKDENEGELPKPLYVAIVLNGAAAQGEFIQLHEGNDVMEVKNANTGKTVMFRTSSVQGIEEAVPL